MHISIHTSTGQSDFWLPLTTLISYYTLWPNTNKICPHRSEPVGLYAIKRIKIHSTHLHRISQVLHSVGILRIKWKIILSTYINLCLDRKSLDARWSWSTGNKVESEHSQREKPERRLQYVCVWSARIISMIPHRTCLMLSDWFEEVTENADYMGLWIINKKDFYLAKQYSMLSADATHFTHKENVLDKKNTTVNYFRMIVFKLTEVIFNSSNQQPKV